MVSNSKTDILKKVVQDGLGEEWNHNNWFIVTSKLKRESANTNLFCSCYIWAIIYDSTCDKFTFALSLNSGTALSSNCEITIAEFIMSPVIPEKLRHLILFNLDVFT